MSNSHRVTQGKALERVGTDYMPPAGFEDVLTRTETAYRATRHTLSSQTKPRPCRVPPEPHNVDVGQTRLADKKIAPGQVARVLRGEHQQKAQTQVSRTTTNDSRIMQAGEGGEHAPPQSQLSQPQGYNT